MVCWFYVIKLLYLCYVKYVCNNFCFFNQKGAYMCLGISVNKEKNGNLLRLLSESIQPLYHTKLLKLLYLIDEESIEQIGCPVTWLDYKAWRLGPVSEPVFYDKFKTEVFGDYVRFEDDGLGKRVFSIGNFDDGEFSEFELKLINDIIEKYQFSSAEQLIEMTHKAGGLWDRTVKENNINFEDEAPVSPFVLDFRKLVEGTDKEIVYDEVKEALDFEASLDKCC